MMNELIRGLQNAILYIEDNLCDELEIAKIAARAYLSSFYFQKVFSATCGMTVGEYIRYRRLSRAAEELSMSDVKVIDVAIKYGYDSPDSFSRAFAKFHGITPSAAKERGAKIKSFAPLTINLTSKGGTFMNYKIVEKEQFTVMGKCKRFNSETSYQDIPEFWSEHYATGGGEIVRGMFGVCVDDEEKEFDYLIADLYFPWNAIPDGCVTKIIPKGTWAVFSYAGECPEALQTLNTQIWTEWFPNTKEYELAGNCSIEFYISETEGEIWIPVKKK